MRLWMYIEIFEEVQTAVFILRISACAVHDDRTRLQARQAQNTKIKASILQIESVSAGFNGMTSSDWPERNLKQV